MSIAQQFVGHDFAVVVGIGVAASVGDVMLVEYLALSRLVRAVTSWSLRPIVAGIGIALVGVRTAHPDRSDTDLRRLKPSLVAVWPSQLIVVAAYPRFAARHGSRMLPAWALSTGSAAFGLYGCGPPPQHSTS